MTFLFTILFAPKGVLQYSCLKWGCHFKLSPARASSANLLKWEKCIASKVGRWIGGQKIILELYALVAVYKYVHIVCHCYIIIALHATAVGVKI